MPTRTEYRNGIPSWIDLSTTDVDASRSFYGSLFGWDFEENPTDGGGTYVMAGKGGHSAAGIMQQQPAQAAMGLPSMWNTYVSVDDIDATLGKAAESGGSVMMPAMQVMDSGSMAVIGDPTGAAVCLWQADQHIGAEIVNEHGTLCWNEVVTPDVPAATAFYGELFGWGTETMDLGEAGEYTVFTSGEGGVAGAMNPPMDGIPPHWSVVFAVDDIDAALQTVTDSGGTVMAGPFDTPVGRSGSCADPQGATFQVIQLSDPAD